MWRSVESNNFHLSLTIWFVLCQHPPNLTAHTTTMKITSHLDEYPNADILWCQVRRLGCIHVGSLLTQLQEEPLNNGAWTYVAPRILTAANETQHHRGKYPLYAGREPTSSVATGYKVCSSSLMSVVPDSFFPRRSCTRSKLKTF